MSALGQQQSFNMLSPERLLSGESGHDGNAYGDFSIPNAFMRYESVDGLMPSMAAVPAHPWPGRGSVAYPSSELPLFRGQNDVAPIRRNHVHVETFKQTHEEGRTWVAAEP